ncbi:MAG: trypsin-like peptidase domain-containing protein [Verrucomicrobiae bacterium]
MRNLLKFLVFVVLAAAVVGGLFFWKNSAWKGPRIPTSALAESDREFTALVGRILPSVVSLNAMPANAANPQAELLRNLLGAGPGAQPQLGSGVIVSSNGYLVTNWHVIEGAGAVEVSMNDGRSLPVKFVGADRLSDVAVLKIEAENLSALPFGDSDDARIGQTVIAVGNPFGLQGTVTKGIVSGKGRMLSDADNEFFQTDAPINPGNSGGPLVDLNGKIIALNNAVLQHTDGIGFAIPANTVRRIFENIRDYGRVIRPWFGVVMLPLTPALATQLNLPDSRGALVQATLENSPASRGGVRPGDVILAYNGRPVATWKDLRNRVAETEPGQEVALDIRRDGKPCTLRVKIEKQPGE